VPTTSRPRALRRNAYQPHCKKWLLHHAHAVSASQNVRPFERIGLAFTDCCISSYHARPIALCVAQTGWKTTETKTAVLSMFLQVLPVCVDLAPTSTGLCAAHRTRARTRAPGLLDRWCGVFPTRKPRTTKAVATSSEEYAEKEVLSARYRVG
jgi:hypothetical protein